METGLQADPQRVLTMSQNLKTWWIEFHLNWCEPSGVKPESEVPY